MRDRSYNKDIIGKMEIIEKVNMSEGKLKSVDVPQLIEMLTVIERLARRVKKDLSSIIENKS